MRAAPGTNSHAHLGILPRVRGLTPYSRPLTLALLSLDPLLSLTLTLAWGKVQSVIYLTLDWLVDARQLVHSNEESDRPWCLHAGVGIPRPKRTAKHFLSAA